MVKIKYRGREMERFARYLKTIPGIESAKHRAGGIDVEVEKGATLKDVEETARELDDVAAVPLAKPREDWGKMALRHRREGWEVMIHNAAHLRSSGASIRITPRGSTLSKNAEGEIAKLIAKLGAKAKN